MLFSEINGNRFIFICDQPSALPYLYCFPAMQLYAVVEGGSVSQTSSQIQKQSHHCPYHRPGRVKTRSSPSVQSIKHRRIILNTNVYYTLSSLLSRLMCVTASKVTLIIHLQITLSHCIQNNINLHIFRVKISFLCLPGRQQKTIRK